MKHFTRLMLFLILVFVMLESCETDALIYVNHPPVPVVYGIFNTTDSIHYVRVGRSFGALHDPAESAGIKDSVSFSDAQVEVRLLGGRPGSGSLQRLEKVDSIPKDSGFFYSPDQSLFRFSQQLSPATSQVEVRVKIPGLPDATAHITPVQLVNLNTPKLAQQYIYLVPSSPWLIQWDGNPWNEIDVAFEFLEDRGDSVLTSRWVHIQNTNYFDSPHDRYREMKITYDEFLQETLAQILPDPQVKRIFLGYITINIHGGDENMVNYMKYINGFNDFSVNEFSNVENGIGLLASRTTFTLDSLRFDYNTRQTLINENRLKVLKISPWN